MFCFFCQNNNKASKTIIDGGVDFAGALGPYETLHTLQLM